MKNKKAVELSLNVIVIAAITLVILVVSIMVFMDLIGQSVNDTKTTIGTTTDDHDNDGIKDFLDKCPCWENGGKIAYSGCPEKLTPENREKYTSRDCLNK